MNGLTVGSLFAGIGGFDLGFHRAGLRTVWFCEQDPFCRRVLAKHWPGVPCHPDVCALVADADSPRPPRPLVRKVAEEVGDSAEGRSLNDGAGPGGQAGGDGGTLPVPVPYVDVLCAGWPCPGFSHAGRGEGFDHAGSGLWTEIVRLLPDLRPRYLVLENVAALLGRGAGRVLGDLAACGYDAEWDCIPASAVGAPHRRDRFWLVAYAEELGRERSRPARQRGIRPADGHSRADTGGPVDAGRPLHDAVRGRHGPSQGEVRPGRDGSLGSGGRLPESRVGQLADGLPAGLDRHWDREPEGVPRVARNVPDRNARLRALGNSLVPQIAEWIGARIVAHEAAQL